MAVRPAKLGGPHGKKCGGFDNLDVAAARPLVDRLFHYASILFYEHSFEGELEPA